MRQALAVLALMLGLQCAGVGAAEIPDLLSVPGNLSAEQTAWLNQRLASLLAEENAIGAEVARHDSECAAIDPDNSSLLSRCSARQAQILARINAYGEAVEAYNKDVRDLQEGKSASAPGRAPITVPMGRVTGEVAIYNGSVPVSGSAGQEVSFDKVETGPRSSFAFDLPNGTVFTIGPNSSFALEVALQHLTDKQRDEEVQLDLHETTRGIFRFKALLKGYLRKVMSTRFENQTYEIRTSYASIGVRGTDFIFEIAETGASTWRLLEGEIEIMSLKNQATLVLKPGQEVVVSTDGKIGDVQAIDSAGAAQAWDQALATP